MTVLKGITWDHDRGYLPLLKTTESFEKLYPHIQIQWRKRSLKEFGDYPVEALAREYDLLLIDHPFAGEAYTRQILVDYNRYMSPGEMRLREEQELGKSHRCYNYKGRQLALSVDIAAMVSVVREDLLRQGGYRRPGTLEEVFDLAEESKKVALPLISTDIWDIFLSLGAALAGQKFVTEHGFEHGAAVWAMEQIGRFRELVPECCLEMNPIQLMDWMSGTDDIFYTPFCFGYVSYAWKGRHNSLSFYDSPLFQGAKTAPILGGVGIAVSALSQNIEEAVRYVEYVTRPETQAGEYFLSGGQPGQRDAWLSEQNNELTHNFFNNTRATIENAYLRPRFPGWNCFQEKAGELINREIRRRASPAAIVGELEELFESSFYGLEGEEC